MANSKMKFQPITALCSAILLTVFSQNGFTGELENRLIQQTISAYGGDKLSQLKNLKFTDNMLHFFAMQSGHSQQGPMTTHLNKYQIETIIDFENQRKNFKRVTNRLVGNHGSDSVTTTHQIFDGTAGYSLDQCLQNYRGLDWINFNNADAGYTQMLDTLIIKQLENAKDNSQHTDVAYIEGQAHDVLTINSGTKQQYTLYINQQTHYLTRMLKMRGQTLRSYDFLNHQQTQGITWAKQMVVSTDKTPIYYTDERNISVNLTEPLNFKLPSNYQATVPTRFFDSSKLTIRKLADNIYFVGQNWGYTLFIDVGDHYISIGAWQESPSSKAWQRGLELLNKTTGTNKPVGKHIVTHHHTDHMAGLNDIVSQGTSLVVHTPDIPAVKQHLQQNLANDTIIPVGGKSYLAGGKIMLFDLPTSHASHNLMLYLPEHGILFTEDIFGSSYQADLESPNSWPSLDTYQRLDKLVTKINKLDLNVEQYVSSHHGRILSQNDIDKAQTLICPAQNKRAAELLSL